jgi:bacterioferritin
MGTMGRQIVGEELAREIIDDLNRGIAAEANDAYRYLVLSKLAVGIHSGEAVALFARTAQDEWGHASILIDRIVQLGGRPMASPKQAGELSYVAYKEPPKDETDLRGMLEDSLEGERAAIRVYKELFDTTRDRDPLTAEVARQALADEVEDESELERLLASWPEESSPGR